MIRATSPSINPLYPQNTPDWIAPTVFVPITLSGWLMSTCGSAAAPTIPDVRAHGLFANGVEGFAAAGGILELTFVDDHLGFVINRAAARRAGLQLGSSLFSLATRIIDEDDLAHP